MQRQTAKLNKQQIKLIFLEVGYSPLDYLYPNDIARILDQLNEEEFDSQTLEQMTDQCKTNSKGQIQIEQLINTFVKAETILIQRDRDIKESINNLNRQRVTGNGGSGILYSQNKKFQQQLQQLNEEQASNNINLQIIRKPFSKTVKLLANSNVTYSPHRSSSYAAPVQSYAERPVQQDLSSSHSSVHTHELKWTWILQLTVFLLVLTFPVMLYHNCFMTTIVLCLILINILSGYFCKTIVRTLTVIIGFSLIVDVVWLFVGTRHMWEDTLTDWPNTIYPFLRLSVIFYGVVCIGKIALLGFFLSQYNTDETEKRKASFFGFYDIPLSHQDPNRNLFPMLNMPHHQEIVQYE